MKSPMPARHRADAALHLLVFSLADRRFGVPAERVVSLEQVAAVSPLPGAPDVVEGVLVVRGEVAVAYDLRARFGLPSRAPALGQHLVVARARGRTVVFRVDEVEGLVPIAPGRVVSADTLARGVRHVSSIASDDDDGMVLLHDLDAFLDADEVTRLDRALAEADRVPE